MFCIVIQQFDLDLHCDLSKDLKMWMQTDIICCAIISIRLYILLIHVSRGCYICFVLTFKGVTLTFLMTFWRSGYQIIVRRKHTFIAFFLFLWFTFDSYMYTVDVITAMYCHTGVWPLTIIVTFPRSDNYFKNHTLSSLALFLFWWYFWFIFTQ